MDIFNVLYMLGGLAFFLFGMNMLGDGLAALSGGKFEKILEKLVGNPVKAVLVGAGVTALIQSSSATTVMVVGFVNSGIMKLSQAVGIIMGANIGTTATSWILSLAGLESDAVWIKLLKPTSFAPVLAFIGIAIIMFAKKETKKHVATILIGFAILMSGMDTMSDAVKPLADVPEFTSILTMFSNPILGMLAGVVLTAVIQSSSASVGILQALAISGAIGYSTAIPIIMGQNIGTCVTAMISSIGASKNARRAALVHLYFNVIGTVTFMILFYVINAVIDLPFMGELAEPSGIAVVHSVFNIFATVLLLPFSKLLVKLATLTVKDDKEVESVKTHAEEVLKILDPRFLETPSVAISHAKQAVNEMAVLASEAIEKAVGLFDRYNEDDAQRVVDLEDEVDIFEDQIGNYLVKASSKKLSNKDSHIASVLLNSIGNLERISDHARNIKESAKEMKDKGVAFSEGAKKELLIYRSAVKDIVNLTMQSFNDWDVAKAKKIEPIEEVIDDISLDVRQRHIKRLQEGKCTIELGFILSDILTNYERVSDHCSNIALLLLEKPSYEMEPHAYLNELKNDNDEYAVMVQECRNKYMLP